DDLLLLRKLYDEYENYSSKAKFEIIIKQFRIPAFTMVLYLLQIQIMLQRIKLAAIPKATTEAIHGAMRNVKHRLFADQPMRGSVFDVHISFCCNKVLT